MHYATVFDASVDPYRNLTSVLPAIPLLLISAVMVIRPGWVEAIIRKPIQHRYIFRWFCFLFLLFVTVTVTASMLSEATIEAQSSLPGSCATVEGRVEHFHPMPESGHDSERFDVEGVQFSYSDYDLTGGFNNTASHGGPIREGLPVRICYRDGKIMRLEVAR